MPEKAVPTYPRFVVRRNVTLIILGVFLFLSAITFFLCYEHHRSATEQFLKEDRAAANLLSLILEEHLQRIVKTMESYANRPLLLQAVKGKNAEKAREHLRNLAKNNPGIDSVVIVDKQGTFWASHPERPESLGMNFAYRDWYKGVSKDWKPYISDVFMRRSGEKDVGVQICVPFFDETGEVIGILLNTQRTIELSAIIQRMPLDPGSSVSVTDRKGNMVYSSRYTFDKEITPYPFYPAIHRAEAGKDRSVTVEDLFSGGGKRYISFASVTDIGWRVFVGRSSRTIFFSEMSHYIQIASIALLLFLMTALFLVYFRKRVMIQQITEQLRAEQILSESEERFRLATRATNDVIWDWDLATDKLWWGEGFRKVFGYTEEATEPTIDSWYNHIHPDERDRVVSTIRAAIQSGEEFWFEEYRFRRSDGSDAYILDRGYVIHDDSGKPVRMVGAMIDITSRKQAEEEIRETRDYLENLITYANAPIIVWNPDYHITRFNHAFEALTGITTEEIVGKEIDILFPEDSKERSLAFIRRTSKGERWEVVEIPILHRNGTIRTVLWNSATLYGQDGTTPVATIAQGQDITSRKQAEEEVRTLNTELEQRVIARTAELQAAYKELEAFSYSVSHDLRAPLRSIDGFSQALLEDYTDKVDDEGKDYLMRVRMASQRMGQLIDDLLRLSRVSRAQVRHQAVDLTTLAESVTNEITGLNPERHVDLSIDQGVAASGDPDLMRIVMENLFHNAYKFTRNNLHPAIAFGSITQEGKPAYFVRDNGVGFDMQFADKLFGAFQRLHAMNEFEGTGIGLATVQRIIHKHGGKLWAESEPGKGATFYFTL